MKKLFIFFLALAVLFLAGCNQTPSAGTSASGKPNGGTAVNGAENWQEALWGKVVYASSLNDLIDVSSRIVFEDSIAGASAYGSSQTYTFYYSKADGKAYVYCFDPLCDHKDCMACPKNDTDMGWSFGNTFFYQNRFWCVTSYGKLVSFSFDGTDKRIEYDLNYEFPDDGRYTVWNPCGLYGPYLYISLKLDQSGAERETLRYNMETREMENLTEKTGNVISPHYFYNGTIYGISNSAERVDAFFKADLDLKNLELLEEGDTITYDHAIGSVLIGDVYKERTSIFELPEWRGISFYNIETGEKKILTAEDFGMERPHIVYTTDAYVYFYNSKTLTIGTTTVERPSGSQVIKIQKFNDGKLYRMNTDGTDIVCVYDNPDYELSDHMVIYGDKVVMQGSYIKVENGEKKIWGGSIQVADINGDGTFGEFKEVEILR